jgi:hypothetical protein
MTLYFLLNPFLAGGFRRGIVGATITLFTTIIGVLGYSKAAKILELTVWKKYGYGASWKGVFPGIILGFVYGFLIVYSFSFIYNILVSVNF